MSHVADYFDSRGTDGQEPGWRLFFTLAPQEMGRTAGARGAFVAPQSREYAYKGLVAGMSPLTPSTPAEAWLDDLERVVGLEVRGQVKAWVAGGLSEQRLKKAIRGAVDPRLVYERLRDADKGIYQHRIVIDDYNNIPSIKKERYVPNGLPDLLIPASRFGIDNADYDLPRENANTFRDSASLFEFKPGDKLYRVTNDPSTSMYAMTGGYWTRQPPNSLSDVIGGTAVMPEWNNYQRVYEFTVPEYNAESEAEEYLPKIYGWEGPTASQAISGIYKEKIDNGYSLPGGQQQIFFPNVVTRHTNFRKHIKDVTSIRKKW